MPRSSLVPAHLRRVARSLFPNGGDPGAYAPPPATEYAWARRLGIHVNRRPKHGEPAGRPGRPAPPAAPAVLVRTLHSPTRYTAAQVGRARALAAALPAGRLLVLCERPARPPLAQR